MSSISETNEITIPLGIKVIKPYRREPKNKANYEGSLYDAGHTITPGCSFGYQPTFDLAGTFRTGLDENAPKIKNIPDKAVRDREIKRIRTIREFYEKALNESLAPDSAFYAARKEVSYTLEDKENVFNLANPDQAVTYYWLMETGAVAESEDDFNSGKLDSFTKFYVYDKETSNQLLSEKKRRSNRARVDLDQMSDLERKQVAMLIGLNITSTSTPEEIYVSLDNYLGITKGFLKNGDPIDHFNSVISMSKEVKEAKVLIQGLLEHNILRIGKGNVIMEGNNVFQDSEERLEMFFLDPKNREYYMSFQEKLGKKLAIGDYR